MTMAIPAFYDLLGTHIAGTAAATAAGVVWQGTSDGGMWATPVRPFSSNDDIPRGALFIFDLAGEEPDQWINGGSFSGQRHKGVGRIVARSSTPESMSVAAAWLAGCMEGAHGSPPSTFSDLRFLQSFPRPLPSDDPNELKMFFADFRWRYSEA